MYLSTMHSLSDTVPSITLLGYASNMPPLFVARVRHLSPGPC